MAIRGLSTLRKGCHSLFECRERAFSRKCEDYGLVFLADDFNLT